MIHRAATIANSDGRTLEGTAFRFEHPSRVTDDGRNFYLEEFAPECADRSMRERGRWALGIMHPWSPGARTSPVPVGAVTFERAADRLRFIARVSRTVAGDETLELINDGALGDVSISAKPIRDQHRPSRLGRVVRRAEIAIRELSLAPPGMGQHEGAQVEVVRTEADGTPRLDAVRRRLVLLEPM